MARADKQCKANLNSYTNAFNQKTKLLDKMIKTNAKMFFELDENRKRRKEIDLRIAELKKELKNTKHNKVLKTGVGAVVLITATLIVKNNYRN